MHIIGRYTVVVQHGNHITSSNERGSYPAAMALFRKKCREHSNGFVRLYTPDGRKLKDKDDMWAHEYELRGGER